MAGGEEGFVGELKGMRSREIRGGWGGGGLGEGYGGPAEGWEGVLVLWQDEGNGRVD